LRQCSTRKENDNDAHRNPPPPDNHPDARAVRRGTHRLRADRSKLFGNSADERLHYDWSDPNQIVLTTTDSNVWGGASGHTYTFRRQPNGTTEIDVVVVRDGKNLKGRLLGLVVGTIGRGVLKKAFVNSVKAIEARNGAAREGGAA